MTSRKKNIILIILCILLLLGIFMWLFGIDMIKSAVRKHELKQQSYYVIYNSYHQYQRESYDIFVMLNKDKTGADEASVKQFITDEFIAEMRDVPRSNELNGDLIKQYGEHNICVHLLFPTDNLPYGWEQTYLNIAYNTDFSIITNAEYAELIIPAGTSQAEQCDLSFTQNN